MTTGWVIVENEDRGLGSPEEVISEKNESGKRRGNVSRPRPNENSSTANPLRRGSFNPPTVKIIYCPSLVNGEGAKTSPRPLNVPPLQIKRCDCRNERCTR